MVYGSLVRIPTQEEWNGSSWNTLLFQDSVRGTEEVRYCMCWENTQLELSPVKERKSSPGWDTYREEEAQKCNKDGSKSSVQNILKLE